VQLSPDAIICPSKRRRSVGKIRVLIADDHAVVREGTRRMLEQEDDMEVVGEAVDGEEAVRLADDTKPDVAIVDISMPKLDGIEATKQIKSRCPSVTILILSAYDDDQFVFSLLEAGAAGYLLKSVRSRELIDAVRAVYAGESVLHPSVAKKVLNHFVTGGEKAIAAKAPDVLSDREKEILRMATQGLSNAEIAKELCLSIRTVQGHLGHIFNKLQVSSRTEAVVRALKEGWVTLEDVP
jgi:NarL family two-component system response regulator LiaR